MARLFDDANTQYLRQAAAVYTAVGFSVHAWARSDSATVDQAIFAIGSSVSTAVYMMLRMAGATAGDPCTFGGRRGGAPTSSATTSTGYTVGQWHSVLGVEADSAHYYCYIDGGSKGTDGSSVGNSTALDRTNIGRLERTTSTLYFSGDIAEVALWGGALSDADAVVLAKGICPLLVRPDLLVAYWPVIGNNSPETDLIGAFDLTLSASAPTKSAHPRVARAVQPYVLKATYSAPPPAGGTQFLAHGKYW